VSVAKELAAGKLVKNLTLFPSIQITLVHPGKCKELLKTETVITLLLKF
jgi:hypothetical protein